ncbi:MAG: hypothetical protein ACFFED_10530 [Candidatus Thorarchaeota archaeon]
MVNMQAYDDLKLGLSMAKSKILTFFLAIIGILVILGLTFAVITLPIGLAVWLLDPSADFITQWVETLVAWTLPLTSGSVAVILSVSFLGVILPLSALAIWVLGALFGIAKEYIETQDTRVEHAFTWLRKKFVPLIVGGILLAIVIGLPALIVGYIISWAYGFGTIPWPVDWIEGIIGFIYFFIMLGLFSLVCPAIVDDMGAMDALKYSFRTVRGNMNRVFGFLILFMLVIFILVGPLSVYSVYLVSQGIIPNPMTDVLFAALTAWTAIGAFIFLLFLLPALIFGLTNIHKSLKGATLEPKIQPTS